MRHFEHSFGTPTLQPSSDLDKILNHRRGWFTDSASTAHIHPIFKKEIFSNIDFHDRGEASFADHQISNHSYDSLRPALRLASAMLEKCRDYWLFILRAPMYYNSATNTDCFNRHDIYKCSRAWSSEIDQDLDSMARDTQICWFKTGDDTDEHASGLTTVLYKPHQSASRGRLGFRMALYDRLVAALNDPDFDNKPTVQQCVVHINIAVTLVHELAHCLHLYRRRDYLTDAYNTFNRFPGLPKVFVVSAPIQELGYLFESFLLGGLLRAGYSYRINSKGQMSLREEFDGSRGLNLGLLSFDGTNETLYRISDETILRLLHESTWQSNRPIPIHLLPDRSLPDHRTIDAMLDRIIAQGSQLD